MHQVTLLYAALIWYSQGGWRCRSLYNKKNKAEHYPLRRCCWWWNMTITPERWSNYTVKGYSLLPDWPRVKFAMHYKSRSRRVICILRKLYSLNTPPVWVCDVVCVSEVLYVLLIKLLLDKTALSTVDERDASRRNIKRNLLCVMKCFKTVNISMKENNVKVKLFVLCKVTEANTI